MTHVDRLRWPACCLWLGLLVLSGGCGSPGGAGENEGQPGSVETLGFAQGLKAHFSSRRTAPEFTNNTPFDLADLDLKITFTGRAPNAQQREERVRWDVWRKGEKRPPEISVEKNTYHKVRVTGTARRDGQPVNISFGVDLF